MKIDVTYRSALITPDGLYRYVLDRRWRDADMSAPYVAWIMLNPSTADANEDDPTIRRCMGFTDRWGYSRMAVLNRYAYRATKPSVLAGLSHAEKCGSYNEEYLALWTCGAVVTIAAWGDNVGPEPMPLVLRNARLACLGTTAKGNPRHPLYLAADTPLRPYP